MQEKQRHALQSCKVFKIKKKIFKIWKILGSKNIFQIRKKNLNNEQNVQIKINFKVDILFKVEIVIRAKIILEVKIILKVGII